jgi:hypothetical protein
VLLAAACHFQLKQVADMRVAVELVELVAKHMLHCEQSVVGVDMVDTAEWRCY